MGKDVLIQRQPGCWLRSRHTLEECVIAHWSSAEAPIVHGAKICHRSLGLSEMVMVEERSIQAEAIAEAVVDSIEERMPA